MVNETAALRTLAGAGVPQVVDDNSNVALTSDDRLYLVTEWVEGETLESKVDKRGPLTAEDVLALVRGLGAVVDACHKNEPAIFHRDIKPDNVILRHAAPASPVLLDFGLAFYDEIEERATLTNEQLGNRFLILPELWDHEQRLNLPQSDVAYLAGVAWYAMTGSRPGLLLNASGQMPHRRQVSLPPGLASSNAINGLFDRAFQQDPFARYSAIAPFLQALEFAFTEVPSPPPSNAVAAAAKKAAARLQPTLDHARGLVQLQARLQHEWQRQGCSQRLAASLPALDDGTLESDVGFGTVKNAAVQIVFNVAFHIGGLSGQSFGAVAYVMENGAGSLDVHCGFAFAMAREVLKNVGERESIPMIVDTIAQEFENAIPQLCELSIASCGHQS